MKQLQLTLLGKHFLKILLCVLFLLAALQNMFAQAPTHTRRFTPVLDANINGFYEYLPRNYSTDVTTKYPLLVFFHGVGESGSTATNATLDKVLTWGPPKLINNGTFPDSFYVGGKWFKFIVISPQIKAGLDNTTVTDTIRPSTVDAVIEYAKANYRVDNARIYLCGLSMGGGATWDYAGSNLTYASKLAAITVACGAGDLTTAEANVIAAAKIPVLATHNNGDPTVAISRTKANIAGINAYTPAISPAPKAIYWSTGTHNVWSRTYEDINPGVTTQGLSGNLRDTLGINAYEWMLQYTRTAMVTAATYVMGQPTGTNGATADALNNATITTCSGTFTDPGGLSGDYGTNQNYTITFTSGNGGPVTFDFGTSFSTAANHAYLEVYDGPTTASRLLYKISGVHNGANNKVGQLSSTGTSMTFHFVSDNSGGTSSGWSASVVCSPAQTSASGCSGGLTSLYTFNEDFSPLVPNPLNPNIGPAINSSLTNYVYKNITDTNNTSYMTNDGEYAIVTNGIYGGAKKTPRSWANFTDHTTGYGHMMLVNANYNPDTVYKKTLTGLNPNTVYFVTAWVHTASSAASITSCTSSSPSFGNIKNANIDFKIFNTSDSLVAINSTGNIQPVDPDPVGWRQYNTYYKTAPGETSFKFQISNRASGGCGNDFAIDDIQVRECPSNTVLLLPVKMGNFTATGHDNKYVAIEWITLQEEKSQYFTVQRSKDGISWEDAVSVKAAGNSSIVRTYNEYDYNPYSGTSYYRIKQTGTDGRSFYSDAKKVGINAAVTASVITAAPNPFTTQLKITVKLHNSQPVNIQLCDMSGRVVYTSTYSGLSGTNNFSLENISHLLNGIYTVVIKSTEQAERIKVLKQ